MENMSKISPQTTDDMKTQNEFTQVVQNDETLKEENSDFQRDAVGANDQKMITETLPQDPTVLLDTKQSEILLMAVKSDKVSVSIPAIQSLIEEHKADINTTDDEGNSIVHWSY